MEFLIQRFLVLDSIVEDEETDGFFQLPTSGPEDSPCAQTYRCVPSAHLATYWESYPGFEATLRPLAEAYETGRMGSHQLKNLTPTDRKRLLDVFREALSLTDVDFDEDHAKLSAEIQAIESVDQEENPTEIQVPETVELKETQIDHEKSTEIQIQESNDQEEKPTEIQLPEVVEPEVPQEKKNQRKRNRRKPTKTRPARE